jgi:hypothetical protein
MPAHAGRVQLDKRVRLDLDQTARSIVKDHYMPIPPREGPKAAAKKKPGTTITPREWQEMVQEARAVPCSNGRGAAHQGPGMPPVSQGHAVAATDADADAEPAAQAPASRGSETPGAPGLRPVPAVRRVVVGAWARG